MDIKELSLEEKIGQMLIMGLEDKEQKGIDNIIKKLKIGGIIIYKKNYNNYEQMLGLINNIKEMNVESKSYAS